MSDPLIPVHIVFKQSFRVVRNTSYIETSELSVQMTVKERGRLSSEWDKPNKSAAAADTFDVVVDGHPVPFSLRWSDILYIA